MLKLTILRHHLALIMLPLVMHSAQFRQEEGTVPFVSTESEQTEIARGNQTPITLGSELKGVHLDIVTMSDGMMPRNQRIRLIRNKKAILLTGLNQLQGAVKISNKRDALIFVRLRTLPAAYFMWEQYAFSEAEVIDAKELGTLPHFIPQTLGFVEMQYQHSGFPGILPHHHFITDGFSSPHIEIVPGGFVVTRWIFFDNPWSSDEKSVWKVQEFVGSAGKYLRIKLKKGRIPDMEHPWHFPTRE